MANDWDGSLICGNCDCHKLQLHFWKWINSNPTATLMIVATFLKQSLVANTWLPFCSLMATATTTCNKLQLALPIKNTVAIRSIGHICCTLHFICATLYTYKCHSKLKNMLIYKTDKTLNTPKNTAATAATTATIANKAAENRKQTPKKTGGYKTACHSIGFCVSSLH